MTISDTLNATADLLEREGWIQGRIRSNKGFCLVGALNQVAAQNYHLTRKLIQEKTRIESLSYWNDRPERTQKEVISKLREWADEAARS